MVSTKLLLASLGAEFNEIIVSYLIINNLSARNLQRAVCYIIVLCGDGCQGVKSSIFGQKAEWLKLLKIVADFMENNDSTRKCVKVSLKEGKTTKYILCKLGRLGW